MSFRSAMIQTSCNWWSEIVPPVEHGPLHVARDVPSSGQVQRRTRSDSPCCGMGGNFQHVGNRMSGRLGANPFRRALPLLPTFCLFFPRGRVSHPVSIDAPVRDTVHATFVVNGERREIAFAPHKTLLEVLREDLALTGTKHGCELGECGACTVLVAQPGPDGAAGEAKPLLSCLLLALECEGADIRTVEGLAERAELSPLQAAFADGGAAQCGYCTPAMLLTAQALLDEKAEPTRDEIKEA